MAIGTEGYTVFMPMHSDGAQSKSLPCGHSAKVDVDRQLWAAARFSLWHARVGVAALGRSRCRACERGFHAAEGLNIADGLDGDVGRLAKGWER